MIEHMSDDDRRNFSKKMMESDPTVRIIAEQGKALLDELNKENRITLDQFLPFIPLFVNKDPADQRSDEEYKRDLQSLLLRYKNELGINFYQPTIVVASENDPTELYFLDRIFSRIRSDNVPEGHRSRIAKLPNSPLLTQSDKMLNASLVDLTSANSSEDAVRSFAINKAISSIINSAFYRNNLSPELKEKIDIEDKIKGSEIEDEFFEEY